MKILTLTELYQQFSSEYFQELSTFGALSEEVVKRLLAEGEIFELEPGLGYQVSPALHWVRLGR